MKDDLGCEWCILHVRTEEKRKNKKVGIWKAVGWVKLEGPGWKALCKEHMDGEIARGALETRPLNVAERTE